MYTVYEPTSSGASLQVKYYLGLPCFVRTLAEARTLADPGDSITGWSNSGYPRIQYSVQAGGRLTKLSGRR